MVHSVGRCMRGVQVKLWDPLTTRAIPERLRGVFTTRHYTNPRLPYFYLSTTQYCLKVDDALWLAKASENKWQLTTEFITIVTGGVTVHDRNQFQSSQLISSLWLFLSCQTACLDVTNLLVACHYQSTLKELRYYNFTNSTSGSCSMGLEFTANICRNIWHLHLQQLKCCSLRHSEDYRTWMH